MKQNLLTFVFLLATATIYAQFNCAPGTNCGNKNSILLTTGRDLSGNPITAGLNAVDPNWVLLNNPPLLSCTNSLQSSINGRAYVVNHGTGTSGWVHQAGASPLAPVNMGSAAVSNQVPPYSGFGCDNAFVAGSTTKRVPYIFERRFCVCQTATVKIDFSFRGDDEIFFQLINLDNSSIVATSPTYVYQGVTATFSGSNTPLSISLPAGRYAIRANLANTSSATLGFTVVGTISSASPVLVENAPCCSSNTLTITKVLDKNCNGIFEPKSTNYAGDEIASGWVFNVTNLATNSTISATTDANGNAIFNGLLVGTYLVQETPQSGWIPGSPSNGSMQVQITGTGINAYTFFNCPAPKSTVCCPDLKNLIVNPAFDNKTPPLGFSSGYTYDNSTPNTNTLLPGEQTIISTADASKICSQWLMKNSCAGNFLLTNGANNQSTNPKLVWQQTVNNLKSGVEYKFCAKFFSLKNCCFSVSPKIDIKFSVPGNDILEQLIEDPNLPLVCDFWRQIEKRFFIPNGTNNLTIQIFLHENSSGDGNDIGMDDIGLVELPQTDKNRTDFVVKAVNRTATTVNYIATPNDNNLKDCGVWWKVCEYDPNSPNKCKTGTAIENPSQWWTYPTPVQFWGYNYQNPSVLSGTNAGSFDATKTYLFEMGVFCPCTGWNSTRIAYDLKLLKPIPVAGSNKQ